MHNLNARSQSKEHWGILTGMVIKKLISEKIIGPQMSITRMDYNKLKCIFVIHIIQVK